MIADLLIASAERVWARGIEDVADGRVNDAITEMWDTCGWSSWLRQRCPDGYTRPPDPDWCGIFVGFVGLTVGQVDGEAVCIPVALKQDIARFVLPSCYRLQSRSHWEERAGVPMPGYYFGHEVEAGDVITVGTRKPYGDHIALVVRRDGDRIETIEGNARGRLPSGEIGKGVVRRMRGVDEVTRVYRLGAEHFDGVEDGAVA
jgi:hypothetical protein